MAGLTVNCVVGAGVLGLPGRVYALAGAATVWVLLGAGVLALAVALCLAELAGRFDGPGGPALYLDRAFGAAAGFFAGWLSWIATVLGAASLLDLLMDLVQVPAAARAALMLLIAAVLTASAMSGVGRSSVTSLLLTIGKVALLSAIALGALLGPAASAVPPPGPAQPLPALVLVFFAFVGFERPTAMAGEVRRARLTMPAALLGGMGIVALLYTAVFAACLRDLPGLARSGHPVLELASRRFGPAAGIVDAGAALIVLATLLSQWLTAPRLLLALAGEGRLPGALARLDARRRTPDAAILATGASATALALLGGFAGAASASSAARLLVFLGCAAAMLKLRRRLDAPPTRLRLPGGALIAVAVVVTCTLLLASVGMQALQLAAMVLIGGAAWLLTVSTRRKQRSPPPA